MKKTSITIMQVLCRMTTAQVLVDKMIEAVSDTNIDFISLNNNNLTTKLSEGTNVFSSSTINEDSVKAFISNFREAAGIRSKKGQTIHFKDCIVDIDLYEEVKTENWVIPAKITFDVRRK